MREMQGTLPEYMDFKREMDAEKWRNGDYFHLIGDQLARSVPVIHTPRWADTAGIDTFDYWSYLGWRWEKRQ